MNRSCRSALGGIFGIALLSQGVPLQAETADAEAELGPEIPAVTVDAGEVAPRDLPFNATLLGEGLGGAVASAIVTHPDVQAAQFAVKAADSDVAATKWQRFPSVSVEAMAIKQTGNQFQTQVLVDEPLWTAGRISSSIKRARSAEQSAFAGYDEAVEQIAVSTAQSYFDYLRLTERAKIVEDGLTKHRTLVQTMQRRVQHEVSPLADLDLARSRSAQVELQLAQTRASAAEALQRLRELVGIASYMPPADNAAVSDWPMLEREALVDDAVRSDPTLKRLRFAARAAQEDARIARASILPQLSAQYSYSEVLGHRVGIVLKAQANAGLSGLAVADSARFRSDASDAKVGSAERDLRSQVVRDFEDYDSSRLRAASGQTAAGAAVKVMESYMRQFVSGRRTWLDVMNAVREAMSAQVDVTDARFGAQAAYARLSLRSGRWRPDGKGVSR